MNREQILTGLRNIEREHDCRVLHACESGSRAWGFPSPDSDYDIRFLYVHRRDWYLRLNESRDTLEWFAPGDLDYSGWELRKALRLFRTCNLSLNEHLQSPIVYEKNDDFAARLRALIPVYFNPKKAVFHYRGMATQFIEPIQRGEPTGIKKLFYILRPLLACRWVIEFQSMPPTEFQRLISENETELPPAMLKAIHTLLKQKESAGEQQLIDVPPLLADWVIDTYTDAERLAQSLPTALPNDWEPLNRLFRDYVNV